MQALHDVVKAGWVRYVGMSSCFAYQCQSIFASVQFDDLRAHLIRGRSPSHAK